MNEYLRHHKSKKYVIINISVYYVFWTLDWFYPSRPHMHSYCDCTMSCGNVVKLKTKLSLLNIRVNIEFDQCFKIWFEQFTCVSTIICVIISWLRTSHIGLQWLVACLHIVLLRCSNTLEIVCETVSLIEYKQNTQCFR